MGGIEPPTSALSEQRSTTEPHAQNFYNFFSIFLTFSKLK